MTEQLESSRPADRHRSAAAERLLGPAVGLAGAAAIAVGLWGALAVGRQGGESAADLVVPGLVAALALAAVHVAAGALRFLRGTPRSAWLSIGGGVSIAYVLVHLLPELARTQEAVGGDETGPLPFLEDHAYLLALAGLLLFYGVELHARDSRRRRRADEGSDETAPSVFALHIASFAVYNAIIGYLLVHRVEAGVKALVLFAVALGLHFVVNDHVLREHHKALCDRLGRWLLAAAIVLGWALGAVTEIAEATLGLLLAFIAGGVVLNVIKEELPVEREARFSALLLGCVGYAVLLQLA